MKESEEMHLKSTIYESTLSTAGAVPLPQWGRLRNEDAAFLALSERIHAYVGENNTDGQSLPQWGRLRYENAAFLDTTPSPRGDGGERSEPDRVLAV